MYRTAQMTRRAASRMQLTDIHLPWYYPYEPPGAISLRIGEHMIVCSKAMKTAKSNSELFSQTQCEPGWDCGLADVNVPSSHRFSIFCPSAPIFSSGNILKRSSRRARRRFFGNMPDTALRIICVHCERSILCRR